MSRFFGIICTLVLVVALAVPAQAAVQNVKVSGDLTLRAVYRNNYDGKDNDDASEGEEFLMQNLGLNIDADLTDNVSTQVRVVNQRNWQDYANTTNLDLGVDLANVTFKELFYSPLTMTLGRQDITLGRGMVFGDGSNPYDPEGSISADEYSEFLGFDAMRAVLDLDPWTINLIWAKTYEGNAANEDDIDYYVANVGYQFESYNAESELYFITKIDNSTAQPGPSATTKTNKIYTVGLRGSMEPAENWSLWGEVAHQFGDYSSAIVSPNDMRDRDAWMANVGAQYVFADVSMVPVLSAEWIYYSGEEATNTGDYEGWDPLARVYCPCAIRDFHGSYYATNDPNDDPAYTNQHSFSLTGVLHPMEALEASLTWLYFRADETYYAGRDEEIGNEINVILTYDYTEDVEFGLLAAWFMPGDYYDGETSESSQSKDTITDIVGTVKVEF